MANKEGEDFVMVDGEVMSIVFADDGSIVATVRMPVSNLHIGLCRLVQPYLVPAPEPQPITENKKTEKA